MKCDLNGWKILSGQFKSIAHFEKTALELFGKDFEAAEVVNGKYLLDGEEVAALFEHLALPLDLEREILSAIISARTQTEISSGISKLRHLLCALYTDAGEEIYCIDLPCLLKFDGSVEKLSSFIRKNSSGTLNLPVPPFAAVCKINDALSAKNLSLPCGSMIIIDAESSPAPDEFCLFLKRDNSFALGTLNTVSPGDLLWSAPVLRLHIIPKQM